MKIPKNVIIITLEKLAKPEYIGIDGLAKMLGVSKSTAYKISASGELSRYRANGKIVRFARADVIAYMEKNRIKSNDKIELEANSYLGNAGSRSGNRPAVRHN